MKNFSLLKTTQQSKNILIICHQRPDGDTFGTGLALYFLLEHLGKNVDIVADSDLPLSYSFLEGFNLVNNQKHKKYDASIFVDCGDKFRAGKFADYAQSTLSINIDHHKSNDYFAKHNVVVVTASSTCEVAYDLLLNDGVFNIDGTSDCSGSATKKTFPKELLQKIASSLLVGLSTDTGHFMHSSVNQKVMLTAARLTELGADIHTISNHIYRTKSKEKIALLGYALSNLRYYNEDSICILSLSLKDFEKFSLTSLSTEGFIDYPLSINSVQLAVTITQAEEELFKISFRSKGIDVSVIAATFGGGGHIRAAGCAIKGVYEEVLDRVLGEVRKYL